MNGRARRRFVVAHWDVFTERPLEGNQLAIFPDAAGLSDAAMQALARETNFSETTFVLRRDPATEQEKGIRVRIFTVAEELPFAGHPTLGTAMALRTGERARATEIALDLNAGRIPVTFEEVGEGRVFAEMRQRDPEFGQVHAADELARATGVPLHLFDPDLPIQTVSTGMPFAIVPMKSLAAVRGLAVTWDKMADYVAHTDAKFLYWVTRETIDPQARLHARMIFYNGEDPATGSAAGCCAAWAVRHGVVRSGERVMIEQGMEMRRPSRIYIRAERDGDAVADVRVGGHAVEVLRGEMFL